MQNGACLGQGFFIALLLEAGSELEQQFGPLAPELLGRLLGLFLKAWLASVEVVKAPGHLSGEFDVGDLIFAHRHLACAVDQDVGRLQQRVAQKAVGGEVFLRETFLLVFVGGHTLEPSQGGAHREQEMQLGMLGHA